MKQLTNPSKQTKYKRDLPKSAQQQAMKLLQWATHEMSKPLRIFHNFQSPRTTGNNKLGLTQTEFSAEQKL